MYKINDLIVYGKTGVYKIMDITVPENISLDRNQLYYVLQPLYQDYLIYHQAEHLCCIAAWWFFMCWDLDEISA